MFVYSSSVLQFLSGSEKVVDVEGLLFHCSKARQAFVCQQTGSIAKSTQTNVLPAILVAQCPQKIAQQLFYMDVQRRHKAKR